MEERHWDRVENSGCWCACLIWSEAGDYAELRPASSPADGGETGEVMQKAMPVKSMKDVSKRV